MCSKVIETLKEIDNSINNLYTTNVRIAESIFHSTTNYFMTRKNLIKELRTKKNQQEKEVVEWKWKVKERHRTRIKEMRQYASTREGIEPQCTHIPLNSEFYKYLTKQWTEWHTLN
jgi:rRNA maturation endonuclease Nob1